MADSSSDTVQVLFADRCEDLVRYIAARLPKSEDARDLAQEAYLRMLRLDRLELVRHPEAYLFRIASNLIYEHWLKCKPDSGGGGLRPDPDSIASSSEPLDMLAGQQQSLNALSRTLRLLPPIQQKVVLMHRRDGLTYAEIAKELGISPDMVKKYLSKGLARCRQQLARYMDDGAA